MSKTNVDLLRGAYDAFARGGIESVLDLMTDAICPCRKLSILSRHPIRGKQGIAEKILARVGEEWDGYWIDVETLYNAGDIVIMQGR